MPEILLRAMYYCVNGTRVIRCQQRNGTLVSASGSNHGIKKTRYDRCLRPPSRIEPSMRVKFESKRRSPVCIQPISCAVLKREICYV